MARGPIGITGRVELGGRAGIADISHVGGTGLHIVGFDKGCYLFHERCRAVCVNLLGGVLGAQPLEGSFHFVVAVALAELGAKALSASSNSGAPVARKASDRALLSTVLGW